MQIYQKITQMSKDGNLFVAADGSELSLIDVDIHVDHVCAAFVPFSKVSNWNDADLVKVCEYYDYQDAERITGGYEAPEIESCELWPGGSGFDVELAAHYAMEKLFDGYQGKEAVNVAA